MSHLIRGHLPLINALSADKVTSENNTSEDWALILDICDRIQADPNGPKDGLKSIVRRLNTQIPVVALQTLTVIFVISSD